MDPGDLLSNHVLAYLLCRLVVKAKARDFGMSFNPFDIGCRNWLEV